MPEAVSRAGNGPPSPLNMSAPEWTQHAPSGLAVACHWTSPFFWPLHAGIFKQMQPLSTWDTLTVSSLLLSAFVWFLFPLRLFLVLPIVDSSGSDWLPCLTYCPADNLILLLIVCTVLHRIAIFISLHIYNGLFFSLTTSNKLLMVSLHVTSFKEKVVLKKSMQIEYMHFTWSLFTSSFFNSAWRAVSYYSQVQLLWDYAPMHLSSVLQEFLTFGAYAGAYN